MADGESVRGSGRCGLLLPTCAIKDSSRQKALVLAVITQSVAMLSRHLSIAVAVTVARLSALAMSSLSPAPRPWPGRAPSGVT
jgi:hypothetical protein